MDFLKLKKEVSETTADIDPDDVLSVKKKLKDLGHYKEPEWGMTNFSDREMFDGIRNFQKEKGLNVDGVMKPDGETERKINEVIRPKREISLSNQNQSANRNMNKDKVIRDRMYPVIKKHEDNIEFPYLDSKGYVTTGLGTNIDDIQKFGSIKWIDESGRLINKEVARYYYQKLKSMSGNNFEADTYKKETPLRLSETDSLKLYEEHINDDLQYLRKTFKNFDSFPEEMQDVLLDIKYNTGNVEADKWPKLHEAISERKLEDIISNVHRKDVGKDRNLWAETHLKKIKSLNY